MGGYELSKIDIVELEKGFRGKSFNKLIEAHINKHNERQLYNASQGTMNLLPVQAKPAIEGFIDMWNERVYSKEIWFSDTGEIFLDIVNSSVEVLKGYGVENIDDEMLFNMFQVIVLNYAYSAVNQPKMQEFMEIKKKKKLFGLFNI